MTIIYVIMAEALTVTSEHVNNISMPHMKMLWHSTNLDRCVLVGSWYSQSALTLYSWSLTLHRGKSPCVLFGILSCASATVRIFTFHLAWTMTLICCRRPEGVHMVLASGPVENSTWPCIIIIARGMEGGGESGQRWMETRQEAVYTFQSHRTK